MRNLKRALSLALASVMLLGMMVVGAGAASYPDVDSNDNVEAIEVLNAVKVMIGDHGSFNPDKAVNRHEMAVIMAKLYLGSEEADNYVGSHPFTDVYPWADKYVAACYENGLVAGTSKTTFGGNQPLTAIQAAAMMLRALGYEELSKGASDWRTPVAAKANEIRLFKDVVSSPNAQLTRNHVAQLALNTLQSDVVVSDIESDIIVEGIVTIPGKVTYNRVLASASLNYNSAAVDTNDRIYLQLCEKLYDNDLRLSEGTPDAMGRPGIEWSYKNDSIGTYASDADRVIVVDKAQTLAKELEDANKNWKMSWPVGNTTGTTDVKLNGSEYAGGVQVGDVVEVYMDGDTANAVGTVAITRYSMDEVTGAIATKGSGDDLQIRIPGFVGYTDADKLNGDYTALEKDDVIYYYQDSDGVYTFAKADSFEGTYTGDKTGTPTKHIVDGSDYVDNGSVGALTLTKQTSYTFYTDANGYLIAAKEIEDAASDYVVIQEIKFAQGTGGITGSQAVEARLVKMDGTVEVVKVKSVQNGSGDGNLYVGIDTTDKTDDSTGTNGSNKWLVYDESTAASTITPKVHSTVSALAGKAFFTYSVNSDKEYELTKVGDADITQAALADTTEIKNGKASMENVSGVAVNRNTVFVIATESGGKSFKVYNGIDEVPNVVLEAANSHNIGAYVAKNGIATYVYVGSYKSSDVDGDTVFFISATPEAKLSKKDGDDTIYYNTYKAVVDGKYTLVEVKAASNGDNSLDSGSESVAVGLFNPTYNSNDLITKLALNDKDDAVAIGYKLDGGTLLTGGTAYTCADDALVFIMDEDGNVTEGAAADIDEDVNDSVYVVKTKNDENIVDFLVIIENAGETSEEAAEEAVADVVGSVSWDAKAAGSDETSNYEPTGTFEVDGNTITASGYTKENMVKGLDDTPRFLGSLYKDGTGVTEIKYNGTTYQWNSEKTPASKWYNSDTSLVSAIVTKMQDDLGITDSDWTTYTSDTARTVTIPLTLNGVDYNYKIVIPACPAAPVGD